MEKIGIFYGSSTENSETVANKLEIAFGSDNVDVYNVCVASSADIEKYSNIIFGCSTWGIGDLQDDFADFIDEIEAANLDSSKVAIFGTGDQCSFPDSFVDSIGIIYDMLDNKACEIIGSVSTEGYNFIDSKAVRDGEFVGLPIDEDNDPDKTDERIKIWTDSLISNFN